MESNTLEKALRSKLRFNGKGVYTVEDLYDVPVEKLNEMYMEARAAQKACDDAGDSLLMPNTVDESVGLRVEILRHITMLKIAEREERRLAADRKEEKARLLGLLDRKLHEQDESKSVDELREMINKL